MQPLIGRGLYVFCVDVWHAHDQRHDTDRTTHAHIDVSRLPWCDRYLDQLHMWMQYFPRDRFFFLHIADLDKKRIRTHLRDIATFLGRALPSSPFPSHVLTHDTRHTTHDTRHTRAHDTHKVLIPASNGQKKC
jgi:hypothetical protein